MKASRESGYPRNTSRWAYEVTICFSQVSISDSWSLLGYLFSRNVPLGSFLGGSPFRSAAATAVSSAVSAYYSSSSVSRMPCYLVLVGWLAGWLVGCLHSSLGRSNTMLFFLSSWSSPWLSASPLTTSSSSRPSFAQRGSSYGCFRVQKLLPLWMRRALQLFLFSLSRFSHSLKLLSRTLISRGLGSGLKGRTIFPRFARLRHWLETQSRSV